MQANQLALDESPRLAMVVTTYLWADSDEKRHHLKAEYWQGNRGAMKKDFHRVIKWLDIQPQ